MKKVLLWVLLTALCISTAACNPADTKKPDVWTSGRSEGAVIEERHTESYEPQEGTADEFKVSYYFTDDMILPRDREIVIWGTAPEEQNGKIVAAEFKGLRGSSVIENGAWRIVLQGTLPASNELGHTLTISGAGDEKAEFHDVLVGDIWIVGGQSNADLTFFGSLPQTSSDIQELYKEELAQVNENDNIRLLKQDPTAVLSRAKTELFAEPQTDIQRSYRWRKTTDRTVRGTAAQTSFSMLGYFFAKEMTTLNPDVPIGMITTSCGSAYLSVLASAEANSAFPESIKDLENELNSIPVPPGGLYNVFVAPLLNVSITGMIFYQGEANASHAAEYGDALKVFVEDLRAKFGSNFMFLNVQLSTYGYKSSTIQLAGPWDNIHLFRFAQAEVKIDGSISNYEIIPSFDVGFQENDADGAHPYYKKEIAQRAAALAAAKRYGIGEAENVGCPIPAKIEYTKSEIKITYDYAGGELKTSNDSSICGFEVLENGEWTNVPASSITVQGNTITLNGFENAEGIRYASNLRYFNTDDANLCSGTEFPAVPFSVEFHNNETE